MSPRECFSFGIDDRVSLSQEGEYPPLIVEAGGKVNRLRLPVLMRHRNSVCLSSTDSPWNISSNPTCTIKGMNRQTITEEALAQRYARTGNHCRYVAYRPLQQF